MKRTVMPDTDSVTEESSHIGDSSLTVYIFGAGASVSAGYPTAADFAGLFRSVVDQLYSFT